MSSHKETARAAIEALGRDLSDTEAELIESIAQALTSAKKYADDTKVGKSGDQTINGALSISGDLYVGGNNYAKQMESLEVGDAVIIANADGVLLSELSGYVIRVKDAEAYAIVYDPADDCVKIGLGVYNSDTKVFTFLEGEAQVLATRADIADGNIPEWDNDKKTFRDSGYKVGDFAKKGDVPTSAANALIGSEMGEVVALKDVSPIEHNLGVRVESKNMLDYTNFHTDFDSVVGYTLNEDKTLSFSGTASGLFQYNFFYDSNNPIVCTEDMFVSGCPSGGAFETYCLQAIVILPNGVETYPTEYGDGIVVFKGSKIKRIFAIIRAGVNVDGLTFEPMLVKGTKKKPYTPYIADTSGVRVLVQGANLLSLDKIIDWGNCSIENGVVTQTEADTSQIPYLKAVATFDSGEYELMGKSETVTASGKVSFQITCAREINKLAFGINGSVIDTIVRFDNLSLPAGTYIASCNVINATQGSISWKDMQIALIDTDYEPHKEPIEYAYGEDIKSIYPSTTLMTDTAGAVISVEYNRDINKAFEELMKIILSLGGNLYV